MGSRDISNYIENTRGRYVELSNQEREALRVYFNKLFDGKIYHQAYSLTDQHHHWLTNRWVCKCLRAPGVYEWLLEQFSSKGIYLIRHPIPASISRIDAGWEVDQNKDFGDFLHSSYYSKELQQSDISDLVNEAKKRQSVLGLQVIQWCFENLKILQSVKHADEIKLLTYEELVLEPGSILKFLSNEFDLNNIDKMRGQLSIPSGSSKFSTESTKKSIKNRDNSYLPKKWKVV